jgi:L-iditol 2-dehydrogenase
MRQALIVGPDRFEVVEVPIPRLQGPGEILVRMAASGICSGDLMPWYVTKKIGTVLGHEVAGWALEIGSNVKHIRPGDLVFMHHHAPCLDCAECRRGAFVHCSTWRASKLDPGGMAEYIRVPADNVRGDTFSVNDLTPEQAVFIEPLACSVKAIRRIRGLIGSITPAEMTWVIIGCGVMGLLNLAVARAQGIGRLIAVDPDLDRRRMAVQLGAAEVLTPDEAAGTLTQAADVVVIGPGKPDVIRQALAHVRPGGTAILFTPTPSGVTTALDLGELYFREINLVPSYSCSPEDTRAAYELLRLGSVPTKPLVTHCFALENIQEAYETARRGGPALKVLISSSDGTSR